MNILNSLQSLDQTLITGPSSLLYLTALLLGAWAIARGIWLLAKEGGGQKQPGRGLERGHRAPCCRLVSRVGNELP